MNVLKIKYRLYFLIFSILLLFTFLNCSKERDAFSIQTSSCSASECHPASPLKKFQPESGKHSQHLQMGYICENCHYLYENQSTHKDGKLDGSGSASIINFDVLISTGSWDNSTSDCSSISCHGGGTSIINWYDNLTSTCLVCHSGGSVIDPLVTGGSGTAGKHIKHVTDGGLSCEKCHDNYKLLPTHYNGQVDTGNQAVLLTLFDSVNPAGQWFNDTGPGTGSCKTLACHGASELDWYTTNTWTLPVCSSCHGSALNSRRQVTGAAGDFGANAAIKSRHITAGSDPGPDQCKVCHDIVSHMNGDVKLKNADGSLQVTYNSSDPSSLEAFCTSCHDANGATGTFITGGTALDPFNEGDGSVIGDPPYPFAAKISESWAKTYGHGSAGRSSASRLTCMGTGAPGTGCHGNNGAVNAHGSIYEVLAAKRFDYSNTSQNYDESWYGLCFDCHANYPGFTKEDVLGVKEDGSLDRFYGNMISRPGHATKEKNPPYYTSGVTTHFADHNGGSTFLSGQPQGMLFAGGYLWVGLTYDGKVAKVDKTTGSTLAEITTNNSTAGVNGLTSDGTYIWVVNQGEWELSKIKISDNSVTALPIAVSGPYAITYAAGYIWVTAGNSILKINPITNNTDDIIDLSPELLMGITYDGQYLWVASKGKEALKIDIATKSIVKRLPAGTMAYCYTARYEAGYIWMISPGSRSITKIDPVSELVDAVIDTTFFAIDMTYDGQYIWVGSNNYDGIIKINVITNLIEETIPQSGRSIGIAYDGAGTVWAGNLDDYSLTRTDTSTGILLGDPYGINDTPVHVTATKNEMNLHWYHMRFYTNFRGNEIPAPGGGEWFKRGELCDNCHRIFDFGKNLTCVNCHNVHGSNTAYGAVYDEMGYTNVSGAWGTYGKLPDVLPNMDLYPTYCAYNCHNAGPVLHENKMDIKPPNKAWFSPVAE